MAKEDDDKTEVSTFDRLVRFRTVHLYGDVTEKSCNKLIEQLLTCQLESEKRPIKMLINSPGGEAYPALRTCDFMEHVVTAPIEGVVVGECSSAATFILLHCATRRGAPRSRYVIHSGTRAGIHIPTDHMTGRNLSDLQKEISEFAEMIIQLYSKKLKRPKKEILKLIARGDQRFHRALSAQEALDIGLITEIVSGKAGIFPEQKTDV